MNGDIKCVSLVSVLIRNVKGKGKPHLERSMKIGEWGTSGRIALIFLQPQR